MDLDSHFGKDHKIISNPDNCSNCKDNKFMTKSKEFITRLQGISNDLVNEKKKHKQICQVAQNCPHEMACIKNCYFLDKSYIESEPEESDSDLESVDDESDESENNSDKLNHPNKCAHCNFEAKNISGLKTHEKTIHRIKCESCNFKTTTKVLLKKHVKDTHQRQGA